MTMTTRTTLIETRLRDALTPEHLLVHDDSAHHIGHEGAKGGGGHFDVTVVSHQFIGKNLIERHRMVYDAMGPAMRKEIHALSIHAYAPEEFTR